MNFEVMVSKGDSPRYSPKNIGFLELGDEKITILHSDYKKDIYYTDIRSIKSKKGIKLTLFNDEIYTIYFPYQARPGVLGMQEVSKSVKKNKMLFDLIEDKMCE